MVYPTPPAAAADVKVLFDVDDPAQTIFPSDLFTVPDPAQNTLRRVDLPKPDCSVQVVECHDIDVLNELDGFNPQPRVSVPFSGPIDISSVNSDTIFFLRLSGAQGGELSSVLAVQAQTQIAIFFATDGTLVIDPDGDSPFFEVPIVPPLPEELNFISP